MRPIPSGQGRSHVVGDHRPVELHHRQQQSAERPGKSAALADYINRLAKAYAYLHKHPDLVIQTTYIGQYHLSPARATTVAKEDGVPSFIQLPGDVAPAQQKLADLFQENGEIPIKVDAAEEFDSRFNAIIQKAQAQ